MVTIRSETEYRLGIGLNKKQGIDSNGLNGLNDWNGLNEIGSNSSKRSNRSKVIGETTDIEVKR
jgi:hypothetical protein